MRNYVLLKSIRIYELKADGSIDPLHFYVVFGTDDANLLANAIALEASVITAHGTRIASASESIYFELDKANVCTLINFAAGSIWTNTHLNNVFGASIAWNTPLLYDMTAIPPAEPSPRKTWSNGH